MIIKTQKEIPSSEITDSAVFKERRNLIKTMLTAVAGASVSGAWAGENKIDLANLTKGDFSTAVFTPTPVELVKNYTNYYEFTLNKEDSTKLAQKFVVDPWSLEIGGEVENAGTYHLEDILHQQTLEERVYRFRCVEAWSMVVPWVGFSLGNLLKLAKPLSTAKFVKFTAMYQPETMPNQRNHAMLDWPYVEALRIDEAMHPLTMLAIGMYGDVLPKQNGAPLRLVVPWKYGFKCIKAVVKIELLENAPLTTWNKFAPAEYGFYANVNPTVPHPRWSQNSERELGSGFFTSRRQTELFNGYAEQVASLYHDMDLRYFF
ncbi:MAG: protein-methionine-sulfoxide reductase catalytic subunit MsrP [Methylococcales bacterium]|nr:protein-methionine-sulfoxide reductase catalytic subunit MsrP [Methylococcales bacterium]MDD5754180.1 protein-methionine-sulfoxide reductase catalytic subunit MsrP [Methylococcales bacterium]